VERRGARYCSHTCRQRAYEFRVRLNGLLVNMDRAIRQVETLQEALYAALADRHIVSPAIRTGGQ
jgi:hypothetical protein